MTFRQTLACGVAAAALASGSARAATINLIDEGGVAGSASAIGFQLAADYWGHMLTNNATINIGVKFAALPPNVIGSTRSTSADLSVASWESHVNTTKSNSVIDQTAILPTLTAGGATFLTNGYNAATGNMDTSVTVFQPGDRTSSQVLFENTALQKAIGININANGFDGHMQFSNTFAFDFNPTDGITAGTFDFLGVAIHEMGHALGFVSGVDFIDYFGEPNGPGTKPGGFPRDNYDVNDTSIFTALDMFRYSNDPHNLAPGAGPVLDETVGTASYFSINGGLNPLFGSANFATGQFNGDGRQASHWKDSAGCNVQLGIMDPTFCFGQMGDVTGLDVAAFDAMGWNLSVDALGGYNQTTAQIANQFGIPEPATWMLSIAGFGLMGAALRRRPKAIAATA
jgi:hypothetical protein